MNQKKHTLPAENDGMAEHVVQPSLFVGRDLEKKFMANGEANVSTSRTGYSVYNEHAKIRTKQNTLAELYPPLPNERFDIIYADPPWHYNGKMQFDKSSTKKEAIDLSKNIFISAASFKYPTLRLDELKKLPLHTIMKDDCLLFMWSTNPHLDQAVDLGRTWGFEYKTVAFVWNKMVHNPGQYTLSYCELCLLFKKGRIPTPRGARNMKQLVNVPRGDHSEKPIEVMRNIEKMFPQQKRIELFARRDHKGWSTWGLEALVPDQGELLE
jgi:N6-adenosine-specific RNA methylase IME4